MSLADVVADIEGADLISNGSAPENDGTPDEDPEPTTLNTPGMMPPYAHVQTLNERSGFALVMSAVVLGNALRRKL